MKKYYVILLAFMSFGIISCEKEVNFNLPQSVSEKIVVEGTIEKGSVPFVLLTKSIGFFSKIDLSSLEEAFIHGADVKVSDGTRTVTLKEYSIDTLGNIFSFYSVDTANPIDFSFIGVEGKAYSLTINYDGKEYTSTTTIPRVKPIDSMWAEALPDADDSLADYRTLFVQYTDPDTLGNCVRIYTSTNSEPFYTDRFSVQEDAIINGTSVKIQVTKGLRPMDTVTFSETYGLFKVGDTVRLKWSMIDRTTFDFWRTLEFSVGTAGNPFSTPIKVGSNISNGALGIWGGYSPSFSTLIID